MWFGFIIQDMVTFYEWCYSFLFSICCHSHLFGCQACGQNHLLHYPILPKMIIPNLTQCTQPILQKFKFYLIKIDTLCVFKIHSKYFPVCNDVNCNVILLFIKFITPCVVCLVSSKMHNLLPARQSWWHTQRDRQYRGQPGWRSARN